MDQKLYEKDLQWVKDFIDLLIQDLFLQVYKITVKRQINPVHSGDDCVGAFTTIYGEHRGRMTFCADRSLLRFMAQNVFRGAASKRSGYSRLFYGIL